jgi:hypothetical protein
MTDSVTAASIGWKNAGIGYVRSAARLLLLIARQSVDSMRSTPFCANNGASHRKGKIEVTH